MESRDPSHQAVVPLETVLQVTAIELSRRWPPKLQIMLVASPRKSLNRKPFTFNHLTSPKHGSSICTPR